MMEILSVLGILVILNGCMAGPRKLAKHERDAKDQRLLDVYHRTSPFMKKHENRMKAELRKSEISEENRQEPVYPRKQALHLIKNKCQLWKDVTGWDEERTDKELANIYAATKTDGPPDREARMRERLLGVDPMFQRIDPEIIRSVVHNWYRHHVGEIERTEEKDKAAVDSEYGLQESHTVGPRILSSEQRSALDQRILDVYHRTDPFRSGHERRMINKLKKETPEDEGRFPVYLRKHAIYLMRKVYENWERITGCDQRETNKLLSTIYLTTKIFGSNQEEIMCMKLRQVCPKCKEMSPEIIRSVVHDWYRRIIKGPTETISSTWSKENEADLLYAYNQVQFGEGSIYDRLAEKWRQIHPNSRDYSKYTLLNKAYGLAHAHSKFSPKEMEEAKKRYERVFGGGTEPASNPRVRKRVKWTREQKAELIRLLDMSKKRKTFNLEDYWQAMYPEHTFLKRSTLVSKGSYLKRHNFQMTPEEENAVDIRLEKVHEKLKQSYRKKIPAQKGGPLEPDNFHEQYSMVHSPSLYNDLHLTEEDWKYLRTVMNSDESHHPQDPDYSHPSHHYGSDSSSALSQAPTGTSHSHFDTSTYDPYTANPYYEHGSSSHSHYNPHP